MTTAQAPFEVLQDPDGLWMLWDTRSETPFEFCGRGLVGLSENEARCACEVIIGVLHNRDAERWGQQDGRSF